MQNLGRCHLCDVDYSSVMCREEHLRGRKHYNRLFDIEERSNCSVCQIEFRSLLQREQHFSSKSHRLNMRGQWVVKKKLD